MAAVKLRICTSPWLLHQGPWPVVGDEVTHFYDILTFLKYFLIKELFKSIPVARDTYFLQHYAVYHLHCIASFFNGF
jgi:hypothetical protein